MPVATSQALATTALAPAHSSRCFSNADCGANPTGGFCMPRAMTKEQASAEDFLVRAMGLQTLMASLDEAPSASPIKTILEQVREDLTTYSQIAHGAIRPGADAGGTARFVTQGTPSRTPEQQMQDAAWLQSGATQAEMIIRQFSYGVSNAPITTDVQDVRTDLTGDSAGLHPDKIIRDLQRLVHDIEVIVAPVNTLVDYREADGGVPGLDTGAGALARYIGSTVTTLNDAVRRVEAFLAPSAIPRPPHVVARARSRRQRRERGDVLRRALR